MLVMKPGQTNIDESQICLGAAILMGILEFLSLFSEFHNSSGYDMQAFQKAD